MNTGISRVWKQTLRWVPVLGIFLLALAVRADDRRIWLQQGVETQVSEKWKAGLQQGFFFANEQPHFTTYYAETLFTRHTRPWLDLGLGFREQFEQRDDDWLEENRPFVHFTFKWTWRDHVFTDRNQIEWRIREDRDTQVRYRNKLMAESPARWTAWGIHPYLADEMFLDEESNTFLRNRIYAGLKAHPRDWLAADLFAIWESNDTGVNERDSVYITGLKLTATF